jgi:hypothetical protein
MGITLQRRAFGSLCASRRSGEQDFRGRLRSGILTTMPLTFLDVDPRELRVLSSRSSGADPVKLHRQIAKFAASSAGMPPIWVYQGSDDVLVITNGVTRATRIAKLAPGALVCVEVIGKIRRPFAQLPKIGDLLP